MHDKTFFLDRAIARSLDWAGQYPALSYAAHDSQSLSNGRQVVAAAISSTGVRCVFFSAIGSVLDFTATWDELGRAKTWWYFVQRWYFWIVPDRQTLDRLNVTGLALDHLIVPACVGDLEHGAYRPWLDAIEVRARRCGSLASSAVDV
ncbi:hypothetical protein [Paraburkholderia strydomiana]|uniref:hypothetical protein n=1 Tax=Paraburkholderia strydomiana TaxID=1245417 RepID=UPI0038B8F41F